MFKKLTICFALISALTLSAARAQSTAISGLYQIISGTYSACCGIGGDFPSQLPNPEQSFIRLTVNSQGKDPTMTILGADMQTVFSVLSCPPGPRIPFRFDYGNAFSNWIAFHVDPGPMALSWNYSVSNSADALRIDGILSFDPGGCTDLPNQFRHTNVVAVLMPTAAVRVSEVEVCWDTVFNRTYQVQYRSTLTSNAWTNLGPTHKGDGSNNCVADKVLPGQPQRYYRILTLPQ
jgi:hypothetical protein